METGPVMVACKYFLLSVFAGLLGSGASAAVTPWVPFGPDGGDARRIAQDPSDPTHLYLGTANGWVYESHNRGTDWVRLAQMDKRDDLVLDDIVVDPSNPRHLIVAGYAVDKQDGGMFLSNDGGVTWTSQAEMRGQSVRSLTLSASDPKVLVAGTLKGVFRTTDGGQRWKQISPADSAEIHEVQSIAIDPKDPNIIYAGTWHLPWKTTDAGEHWDSIKDGIIVDSDVFSIIIDPKTPAVVYASACSGIYKSVNAGQRFEKIQGIPASSRRTRVLLQDPSHLTTVFAGTTEGLFRSEDAGKIWARTTAPDVIVNDVYVDPTDRKRVLIATDRGGVLASDDGGDTFHASNHGFSARQITAIKRDEQHAAMLYVGVVNDKELGGVFQSNNGGLNWVQMSDGLQGRDVFSLGQASDGTMIAGTVHGIFRLDAGASKWLRVEEAPAVKADAASGSEPQNVRSAVPIGRNRFSSRTGLASSSVSPVDKRLPASTGKRETVSGGKKVGSASRVAVKTKSLGGTSSGRNSLAVVEKPKQPAAPKFFDGSVYAITSSNEALLAATSAGLLLSGDHGVSWRSAGPTTSSDWRYLASAKADVVAGSLHGMQFSADSGATWAEIKIPEELTLVSSVAVEPSGEIWVGGREGVYASSDAGATWTTPKNLFVNSVTSVFFDEATNRVFVTANGSQNAAFTVQLPAKTVTYANSGWNLRLVRPMGDHLVAATFFDGLVVQPKVVTAPVPAAQTAVR